mmetsp:Transcript_55452/g.168544  ORF Transcript_55452/g.168544 Transcript_55452/m.168544 type:complete len:419 (-) Transcript_55452:826-2082(-)
MQFDVLAEERRGGSGVVLLHHRVAGQGLLFLVHERAGRAVRVHVHPPDVACVFSRDQAVPPRGVHAASRSSELRVQICDVHRVLVLQRYAREFVDVRFLYGGLARHRPHGIDVLRRHDQFVWPRVLCVHSALLGRALEYDCHAHQGMLHGVLRLLEMDIHVPLLLLDVQQDLRLFQVAVLSVWTLRGAVSLLWVCLQLLRFLLLAVDALEPVFGAMLRQRVLPQRLRLPQCLVRPRPARGLRPSVGLLGPGPASVYNCCRLHRRGHRSPGLVRLLGGSRDPHGGGPPEGQGHGHGAGGDARPHGFFHVLRPVLPESHTRIQGPGGRHQGRVQLQQGGHAAGGEGTQDLAQVRCRRAIWHAGHHAAKSEHNLADACGVRADTDQRRVVGLWIDADAAEVDRGAHACVMGQWVHRGRRAV